MDMKKNRSNKLKQNYFVSLCCRKLLKSIGGEENDEENKKYPKPTKFD